MWTRNSLRHCVGRVPSILTLLKRIVRCVCMFLWENRMCSDGVDSVGSLCGRLTVCVWHGYNLSASIRIVDFLKGNFRFYSKTAVFKQSVLPSLLICGCNSGKPGSPSASIVTFQMLHNHWLTDEYRTMVEWHLATLQMLHNHWLTDEYRAMVEWHLATLQMLHNHWLTDEYRTMVEWHLATLQMLHNHWLTNEYRTMVEWHLAGGKPECLDKSLPQCCCLHHKF